MKKYFLFILLLIIFISIPKSKAYNISEINDLVVTIGVGNDELLELEGYSLYSNNVNWQLCGRYIATYLTNNKEFLDRNIIVEEEEKLEEGLIINNIKTFSFDNNTYYVLGSEIVSNNEYYIYGSVDTSYYPYQSEERKYFPFIQYYKDNNLIWNKIYNEGYGYINSVTKSNKGVICIASISYNHIDTDISIFELSSGGNTLKSMTIKGNKNEISNKIFITNNEIYFTYLTYSSNLGFVSSGKGDLIFGVVDYNDFNNYNFMNIGGNNSNNYLDSRLINNQLYILFVYRQNYSYITNYDNNNYVAMTRIDSGFDQPYLQNIDNINVNNTYQLTNTNDKVIVSKKESLKNSLTLFLYDYDLNYSQTKDIFLQENNYNILEYDIESLSNNNLVISIYNSKINDYNNSHKTVCFLNEELNIDNRLIFNDNIYEYNIASLIINNDKIYLSGNMFSTNNKLIIYIQDINYIKLIATNNVENSSNTYYPKKLLVNNVLQRTLLNEDKNLLKVYGDYKFVTKSIDSNINVIYNTNVYTKLNVNIRDNETYNLNTKLISNGYQNLNNEDIDNNYNLNEMGNYLLQISGNNTETVVLTFKVDNLDIKYLDNTSLLIEDISMEKVKINEVVPQITNKVELNKEIISDTSNSNNPIFLIIIGLILGITIGIFVNFKKKNQIAVIILIISLISIVNVKATDYYQEEYDSSQKGKIIKTTSNYILKEDEKRYIVNLHGDFYYELDFKYDYQIFQIKENLLISYLDNGLNIKLIDNKQKLILEKKILEEEINKQYDFCLVNEDIYLVGQIINYKTSLFKNIKEEKDYLDKKDCFIMRFNSEFLIQDVSIYGGYLNESFYKIKYSNNYLYIFGYKDELSGGDFGNGSSNILVIYDINNNEYLNYNFPNDENLINVINCSSDYIITSKGLYLITNDHEIIKYIATSNSNKAILAYDESILIFEDNLIHIFDTKLKMIVEVYQSKLINEEAFINETSDYLLINVEDQIYKYDLFILKNYLHDKIYYNNIYYNEEVYTIFNKATLTNITSNPVLNYLVNGSYEVLSTYNSIGNIQLEIEERIEILPEANVKNKGIYPINYRLQFTGNATLNGYSILNNYTISEEGKYELILTDNMNNKRNYNFIISSKQLNFVSDNSKIYQMSCFKNDIVTIKYELININNINSVIINGKEYQNFEIIDNILYIRIDDLFDCGEYIYHLEKINYDYKDIKNYYNIDEVYAINVLKDSLKVNYHSIDDNLNMKININDIDKTFRYFRADITNDYNTVSRDFLLTNQDLNINNLVSNEEYNLSFKIIYDINNQYFEEVELFNINFISSEENIYFCNMDIININDGSYSFDIDISSTFKNQDIINFHINEELIYEKSNSDLIIYIISIIVFIMSCIITIIIKCKFKKSK